MKARPVRQRAVTTRIMARWEAPTTPQRPASIALMMCAQGGEGLLAAIHHTQSLVKASAVAMEHTMHQSQHSGPSPRNATLSDHVCKDWYQWPPMQSGRRNAFMIMGWPQIHGVCIARPTRTPFTIEHGFARTPPR